MTLSERPFFVRILIRDLRKQQSLTQEDLAEMLGISRQSVIALESGKYMPSLPLAMQLADVFSMPLERIFLCDGDDETPLLPAAYPPINLAVTNNALVIEAAVVGYSEREIAIDVTAEQLTITGQPQAQPQEDRQYVAREHSAAPFSRTITLPYRIDPDSSSAVVANGMLTVTLPLVRTSNTSKRLTVTKE